MVHLFRPAEAPSDLLPQKTPRRRGRRPVWAPQLLARVAGPFHSQRGRALAAYLALVLGLIIQGALLLTAAYLVDLSISLMELWAELARKHLELTL